MRVAVSVLYLSRISTIYLNMIFRLEFINSEIIQNESFVAASDLMRYEVNLFTSELYLLLESICR